MHGQGNGLGFGLGPGNAILFFFLIFNINRFKHGESGKLVRPIKIYLEAHAYFLVHIHIVAIKLFEPY